MSIYFKASYINSIIKQYVVRTPLLFMGYRYWLAIVDRSMSGAAGGTVTLPQRWYLDLRASNGGQPGEIRSDEAKRPIKSVLIEPEN